ncbi:D-3-phosphoglycerate dehydrogenase 2 [Saitoella coloradoensis]
MSAPQSISNIANQIKSMALSTSPPVQSSFHAGSPPSAAAFPRDRRSSFKGPQPKQLKPFSHEEVKILLLENVNATAIEMLTKQGYQVEFHKTSLGEDELIEKIKDVHAIGIRSKTKITKRVLEAAKNLTVIGCFCIGTNQVDLEAAANRGVAVFNSPFSNSRSVAELVISEIIALARQMCDRSNEMHKGVWNKVSAGCWEVRGKTLGIVGYGHIGSQLSVLAEAMGLRVIYYDVVPLMAIGNANQIASLHELLGASDFVSLHVPELPETKNLISGPELAAMKQGSYLLNNARGTVVDIPALISAMKSGKLAGAAIDVFPNEPAKNGEFFTSDLNEWAAELCALPNLILTPHIGGSTEEAQSMIGVEVAEALTKYINEGSTIGAVNFPEVALRSISSHDAHSVRVCFVHRNIPGVLRTVNDILGSYNVEKQFSDSRGDIAYLIADVADVGTDAVKTLNDRLEGLEYNIRTSLLY